MLWQYVYCTEYKYGCDSYPYIVMPDIVGTRVMPHGQAEQHVQCIQCMCMHTDYLYTVHVYAYIRTYYQMQVAQGQGPVRDCALVQAAIGCCILLLLVSKTVLTLCNLRWWCFSCHQLAQRPHWHLQRAL